MITANKTTLRQRQQGVVAVMAAVMMITLIMFLAVVVDTGRLFLEKRSLQKNADLAALETALLYCRDQTMDDADRRSVALDALSADRNDFKGNFGDEDEDGDIKVSLGRVLGGGAGGRVFTPNSAGENGKAVEVKLTRTIPASLFQQLWPNSPGTITLQADAVAQACEPTAQLTMRSNLATVDSSRSELLNSLLGGLLGTTLNLGVGDWQSLLDTNLNLLGYFDALATELNLDAGNYDSVLTADVSVGELLDVAADVAQAAGDTTAVSALGLISLAIPPATPLIALEDMLEIQSGTEEAGLNTNLQLMQLVQGSIQLANTESGIEANLPIDLGIVSATLKVRVTEPPMFSAVGNPELAKNNPYGGDAIYVRSSQIKVFASLNLPVFSTLDPLLTSSLVSGVANLVSDLLSLELLEAIGDLLCIGTCTDEIIDIRALSSANPSGPSSRIDVLISAGQGEARVTDYSCNITADEKTLTTPSQSSIASVAIGQMDSANAFSGDPLTVEPIPVIDIGKITARRTCLTSLICGSASYKKGVSWVSNIEDADRVSFSGGGFGLKVSPQDPSDGNPTEATAQSLTFENHPDETYLPDIDQKLTENAYLEISSEGAVSDVAGILNGIELEFYEPEGGSIGGNGLGNLIYEIGSVIEPLLDGVTDLLDAALAPLLDNILNNVLGVLGASLANADVGAAMTCENEKVRLVM
jgi:uncharacterized membrane protein